MSIATEVSRIKAAKAAIKSAINAKGGTLTDEQLDQYANAIASLPSGGGSIDLTGVNVTADGLLEGVVAVNGAGQKVTGNIKTVLATLSANVVTVPKGNIAEAQTLTVAEMSEPSVSANVVTIPVGYNKTQKTKTISEAEIRYSTSEGGNVTKHSLRISAGYVPEEQSWTFRETDLNGINATADKMLSGTVSLDAQGDKITGNIPTVTASLENDVVTVPQGYIAEQQTFEVGSSGGSTDFYKCTAVYGPRKVTRIKVENAGTAAVNGEYEKTSLTTSSGGEVWKHLEAEFYLYNLTDYWCINGDYTTYGDMALYYTWNSNLTEWSCGYDFNTSSNTGIEPTPTVSKFQVTLDEDVPKTWDGYKALLTDGIYDFEKELTTGLTYGTSYVPVVGGIYSADALVQVSGLFDNIVNNFPGSASLFALDANVGINDLVGGGAPTLVGSGEVLQNGEFCFDNTRAFDYTIGDTMSALKDFTIEMDYTITSNATGYCGFFGNRSSWSTMCVCMQWGRSGYRPAMFWQDYFDTRTGGAEHSEWVNDGKYHHVAYVRKGDTCMLFSDGEKIAEYSGATKDLNLAIEHLLAVGTQHVENQIFPGRMKHFRVLGEALYDGNFDIPEWVGKGSGSDNGDNGDSGSSDGKTYVYTSEEFPDAKANGNWWDSGKRESAWVGEEIETIVYTNADNYEIYWSDDGRWNMRDATGTAIYAAWDVGYEHIVDGNWTLFDTSDPITGKFIVYQG